MELAIQRGTGQSSTFFGPDSRSIPELVREAIDRGAPFRYVLGQPPELLKLASVFTRGWGDRLDSCHRQLSPPPEGVDQRVHAQVLRQSLFKRSVETLKEGACLVLMLPGSSVIMAARDAQGQLLLLTTKMSLGAAPPLQVYEQQAANDRLSQALQLSTGDRWAMVVMDAQAGDGATAEERHA